MNNLISIQDVEGELLHDLIVTGQRLAQGDLNFSAALKGKLVGIYFTKPSTRTRTSFFAAVQRMGGSSIVYSGPDLQTTTGESLEDTANRAIPYFESQILPRVTTGKNVLVSAHGNSLRAIVMFLENLSRDEVLDLELSTGHPRIYGWDGVRLSRSQN